MAFFFIPLFDLCESTRPRMRDGVMMSVREQYTSFAYRAALKPSSSENGLLVARISHTCSILYTIVCTGSHVIKTFKTKEVIIGSTTVMTGRRRRLVIVTTNSRRFHATYII